VHCHARDDSRTINGRDVRAALWVVRTDSLRVKKRSILKICNGSTRVVAGCYAWNQSLQVAFKREETRA
jgi:hypothetical protein